jgi:hypothetical protein
MPDQVVLAAGDIAGCDTFGDTDTAELLDEMEGTVLVLGDLAYEDGTTQQFADCYDPTWGRHRHRTLPAVGNHEYNTGGAAPYFDYFGEAAGTRGEGWYSRDLGEWHVIALNSNCGQIGGCGPGSPQVAWLTDDLATNQADCTLAFWHHPRWSSGIEHGPDPETDHFWRVLHEAGADVVLNGHEHSYERFAPMDADGAADPHGMVEFVVGTGGRSLYAFDTVLPTSEQHDNTTFGILQVRLGDGSYEWEFVPVEGGTYTDTGEADCR